MFSQNLAKAADKIIETYKFLTAEDLKVVSQEFQPDKSYKEEELFSKLDEIVKVKFSSKYESFVKDKVRREILADESGKDLGGIGESLSSPTESKSLTEYDKLKARYKKSLPKRFQY